MLKRFKIKKRLTVSFIAVACIASVAGIVACIAMFYLANQYDFALVNYGFSQADIGKAMTAFADSRSYTRGVIGYSEAEDIATALTKHDEAKAQTEEQLDLMDDTLTTADEEAAYALIKTNVDAYWTLESQILEQGQSTDPEEIKAAQRREIDELAPVYDAAYDAFAALLNTNVVVGNQLQTSLSTMRIVLLLVIIVVIIVAVLGSLFMGTNIANGIAKPLQGLSDRLVTFADGDLSTEFPATDSEDEVADMVGVASRMATDLALIIKDAKYRMNGMANGDYTLDSEMPEKYVGEFEELHIAIHTMNTNMNETLHQIEEASAQVSAGATNLSESSQSLAEGATEQAGAIEELTATITSVTSGVNQTAGRMDDTYKLSSKYADEANDSRNEMSKMVDSMGRISETSKKIESIISEIENIASQTNLLSLNASIEAARAGEAGKGFAVVADQIGKLADESAQSAVNTRELIMSSINEIEEGTDVAGRTATKIEEVVAGINEIANTAKEISELTLSQAEAMSQAEQGVEQISEVVQANSATAEESSATSEELSAQAETLDDLVRRFKLK